uniref:G-protein coupled receptor moody n=2 Tax=Drosophila melanogaster TaxID=7227 RepID=MOODY_DROME|nr:moody, isoform B [Drosophila melanogaster]NP_001259170.1 moody, isoform E [Drosophila melanogaster]NP_001259171.1 moody, isoform F [Drosophila melanogaster]NP_569970.2 moody, isoform A [Drosophila melanogaster]Q9W534.2 RecName: Full=G-protein coupled receptor moody [Drosophila melanogaster]AAF45709.2 moody, isoform A [Drosophila melanogaster]ADV37618.1 moody, isoform B [Drosophila melanogaster]AGB95016.1 moody, isoform E [Drosophila melanogaster]AGB95017.1 moody, isoform F [Drosophila me|eukprot:NP_001188534.1 moody, isoform B [Drosophila melanogaster]
MSDETTISLEDGYPPLEALTTMVPPADATGFSQSLLTFAAVMTFLIMIVGICGNLLTVVALLKCPKVRNVAAAFIISLCIADLLFCALVLPFQGLRFVQGTWRHGQVLCRLIPFIQYGNIGVSLLCIAMITINRYVMITHHGLYARIYKRHWIAVMIAACWLFSYGMQLPTLLGEWGRFGYDSRLQTCSIMTDDHGHSSKTTLFITAFVIPCLVIIACYAKIFWVVHKSEQRLKRHATKQNSIPNNLRPLASTGSGALPSGAECQPSNRVSSDSSSSFSIDVPETAPSGKQQPTRVKDQREVRAKRNEWRITKMVLAIFLSFVVCYLPITIVKVADKNVEHPSLHICSYILLYLSACINPIIYVIMNKQYRKAYKTVVFCQPARLLLPFGKTNGASSAAEKWKDTGLSNNHSRTIVSQMSGGTGAASGAGTATGTAAVAVMQTPPEVQQAQALEMVSRGPDLISKSNLPQPNVTPPPPSVLTATPNGSNSNSLTLRLPLKKNNHCYTNSGFNSSTPSPSSGLGIGISSSSIYRPGVGSLGSGSASIRRITMVGDDIILEEEELPPTPPATSAPTTPAPPPPSSPLHPLSTDSSTTTISGGAVVAGSSAPKPATPTPHIYMNVDSPKRNQYYMDRNTNAVAPESDSGPANTSATVSISGSKLTAKMKFPKD